MRLGDTHLSYCTNIHPGESWAEIRGNLEEHLPRVKRLACPDAPFGVGLRLSAVAAAALAEPGALAELRAFLAREGLYVFTINGFPYGPFHGRRVKAGVYRPDWREPERLDYTNALATLLAALLPEGERYGSVSTVPGGFKPETAAPGARAGIARALVAHAALLVRLERETGRTIALALEPEPCCLLETVAETVDFFRSHLHSPAAVSELVALAGLSRADAEAALRRHLGVCLDLCHAAVEFEEPAAAFTALESAGIVIAKIQVTAGLRLPSVTAASVDTIRRFDDGVYLHQVVERTDGAIARYIDLGEAIDAGRWRAADAEWRVHFHVPVYLEELDGFSSTQPFVREALALQRARARTPHLEVETYTWSVLPEAARDVPLDEAIAREVAWTRAQLA